MVEVLVSWIYIGFICLLAGTAVRGLLSGRFPLSASAHLTETAVYGIAAITVFGEFWSLFGGVSAACHLCAVILSCIAVFAVPENRRLFCSLIRRIRRLFFSWQGLFYLITIAVIAYFASRGDFHADTKMYHAQAIRMIEEYGSVRGLANVQLHFGYNSSYLVFCAFFTMSWLVGTAHALHTTTGFLMALFSCYALHGLAGIQRHKRYGADAMKIGMLIYILTELYYAMSPATDYGTMLMVLYLFCAFLDNAETEGSSPAKTARYGMLSVLALFCVSLKLSAAVCFLIVLCPLVMLIRGKQGKQILRYVLLCVIVILPFLARNVKISGWLFYPFEAIDLFDVEWKVPAAYSLVDSNQIKAWGRCLYDINLVDRPMSYWVPIWWAGQEHYEQMLIYAAVLSLPLYICDFFMALSADRKKKKKIRPEIAVFVVMMFASFAMWFVTAPFVRYGLGFLLGLPLLSIALFIENYRYTKNLFTVAGVFLSMLAVMDFAPWLDHYLTDDLVFAKHHLAENYYVVQKPFDEADMEAYDMGNGVIVYYNADATENNSYYVTPGTSYKFMIERSESMGDSVKDGFRAK